MTTEIEIVYLVVASLVGAIFSAFVRYVAARGNINSWDLAASLLRGVIPAIVFILRFQDADVIGIWDYLTTFIGGAGFESLLKSGQDTVRPPK